MRGMKKFEIINHTADIGIRVFGKTLEDLFVNAAFAMSELIVKNPPTPPFVKGGKGGFVVKITAVDKEQLLVKWLSEILYLIDAKNLMPVGFKISEVSDTYLAAAVAVEPFDPAKHKIKRQIKAVTYHGLAIKKAGGQFEVSVIFDI